MSSGGTAIVTGASRGLGLALAGGLARLGWRLVIDARGKDELGRAARGLSEFTHVHAVVGDVADAAHRQALVAAAGERIDLLVNNASVLGPSPQPELGSYPLGERKLDQREWRPDVYAEDALELPQRIGAKLRLRARA